MSFLSSLFGSKPTVHPEHVQTLADFQEKVVGSDLPVLLNVWSPTCPPCRKLAPVLTQVATKHSETVRVVSVGTTSDMALLGKLNVRSTPTTIIFDGGEEIGRVLGFRPPSWFDEMIQVELTEAA